MATFLFDEINKIITISGDPLPTEATVQQLINAIRDWEDDLDNIDIPKIADASGKEDLGGGLQVGITLKLYNWKVKFQDRLPPTWIDCVVSGGNLVAVDANNQPMNPIAPASYVTVTIVKAVSAALLQALEILAIKAKTDNLPAGPAEQSLVQDVRDIIGTPTLPTIAEDLVTIQTKTHNLPDNPADEALVEAHVTAEIDSVKGTGWTTAETLKKIKELVETVRPKPGFKV